MKEQDNLERFLRDNRSSFDDAEPSDRLWEKITSALPEEKQPARSVPLAMFWKVAAVFFFFATSILGILQWQNSGSESATYSTATDEFQMAENYYLRLIHEKHQDLQKTGNIKPELLTKFNRDINVLDSLYGQLKNEITEGGNLSEVQDAMVQNLKLRIEVLNYQLDILENIKTIKKNETSI